jgi:hypothetical protein
MFMFGFIRKGVAEAVVAGVADGFQQVQTILGEAETARSKDKEKWGEVIEGDFREVLGIPAPAKKGK